MTLDIYDIHFHLPTITLNFNRKESKPRRGPPRELSVKASYNWEKGSGDMVFLDQGKVIGTYSITLKPANYFVHLKRMDESIEPFRKSKHEPSTNVKKVHFSSLETYKHLYDDKLNKAVTNLIHSFLRSGNGKKLNVFWNGKLKITSIHPKLKVLPVKKSWVESSSIYIGPKIF